MAIFKKIEIVWEEYKKWIVVDLPKWEYEKLFKWKQLAEEFDELWPLLIQDIVSKEIANVFELSLVGFSNKTKKILIQPKNHTSQRVFKSYISWALRDIWINANNRAKFKVNWKDTFNTTINFTKTVKDGFDINLNNQSSNDS